MITYAELRELYERRIMINASIKALEEKERKLWEERNVIIDALSVLYAERREIGHNMLECINRKEN